MQRCGTVGSADPNAQDRMKGKYETKKIFNSGTLHKHIPSVQVRAKIDCKVLAFFVYKTSDYFGLFFIYNEYSERPPKRGRLFF